MKLKSRLGKYFKSKGKFITAGWISIMGGILWILPFLWQLEGSLNACINHGLTSLSCSNILYLYVLPTLIIFMGSYYLYLGYKQKTANLLINASAFILITAVLVSLLFMPLAIISCIIAPDPLCPVGGLWAFFAGGFLASLGLFMFIIGILSTLIKGK